MNDLIADNSPKLIKNQWGFYQFSPLPNDDELEKYYSKNYYQEGCGSYEVKYSDEEIEWFRLRADLINRTANKYVEQSAPTFLDVGCGEGWLLSQFYQNGYVIKGIDFSKAGLIKVHPELKEYLQQGNVYNLLDTIIESKEKFDVIALCNVIEHVRNPVGLLSDIRRIMHPDTILVISAPNDFSKLHEYLLKNKIVSNAWWLNYPDHLSYFNKESMSKLLFGLGFNIKGILADNPIDLNLINENSDYINDKTKGKNTHMFRVRVDNFLASIDTDKLLSMYKILGEMGVGRNLNYFCSLKR